MPLCAGHRLQLSGAGKAGRTHPWVPDRADPGPLDLRLAPKARRGEASAVLSLLPRLWSPQEMMTWALGDLEGTHWHVAGWTVAVIRVGTRCGPYPGPQSGGSMQKAAIPSKTTTSGSFSKPWTLVLQARQVIHAAGGLGWAAGEAQQPKQITARDSVLQATKHFLSRRLAGAPTSMGSCFYRFRDEETKTSKRQIPEVDLPSLEPPVLSGESCLIQNIWGLQACAPCLSVSELQPQHPAGKQQVWTPRPMPSPSCAAPRASQAGSRAAWWLNGWAEHPEARVSGSREHWELDPSRSSETGMRQKLTWEGRQAGKTLRATGPREPSAPSTQGAVHHRVQNSGTQIQFQP